MSNQTNVSYLYSLSTSIQYYSMWTILPTCVVGNLISLYIYTRPNLNKKTNTGFLYGWLCILDILTIVYYSVVYRGNSLFKYTLSLPCGMDNYIRRTALNSITWMQVIICLDRFVAVLFPTKMAFWSKKIVLYGVMLSCLGLILIVNMTNLMTYPVTSSSNKTSCSMSNDISIATNLIANVMRVFIPFGLMLTLNILIIYRLKQSKIKVGVSNVMQIASQQQSKQTERQLTNKEFRFMVSTLIIDFVFLFFYLPMGVSYIIATYNQFNTSITGDSYSNAVYNLFNNISQLIAMAHTSVLFFVFVIFNRYFRLELIYLLRLQKLFPSLQSEGSTNATRLLNNQSQLF